MKKETKNIYQKRKKTLYNIEQLYKARTNIIKFFYDYSSMVSKGKHEATKGKGLKILTPKKILQKLPIVLEQVKAGTVHKIY